MCKIVSLYYSQCVPDSSTYRSSATGCISNYGSPCTSPSNCCDPGAVCNNGQCAQPAAPSCLNPTGYGAAPGSNSNSVPTSPSITSVLSSAPSPSPTVKMSLSPSSAPASTSILPICQYGGYCRSTGDCALGNKCVVQSAYYSQCLPDPSQYSTTSSCVSSYSMRCSASPDCCDPGAVCIQTGSVSFLTCVPMQPPLCATPVGYPAATAVSAPSTKPSAGPSTSSTGSTPSVAPSTEPAAQPSTSPTLSSTYSPSAMPSSLSISSTEPVVAVTSLPTTLGPTSNPTGRKQLSPG